MVPNGLDMRFEMYFSGSNVRLKIKVCLVCCLLFWNDEVIWWFLFFPQLVKTADLDPRQNYVVGFHPHGVLVAGGFTNFCTNATGFNQLFPGLTSYLLMLPLWFRAPFFRDYIMCAGVRQKALIIFYLFVFFFNLMPHTTMLYIHVMYLLWTPWN